MISDKEKTLITTAIDYTNDVIHIGHAYQKILADCLTRYERHRIGEKNVYFLTGTDEFGTTSEKAAKVSNLKPKDHVDKIAEKDKKQLDSLNISYNRFIRTTDKDHQKIAADFFSRSLRNDDIYKDSYTGLYCEGCEAHKTLTELNEDGQCPLHPTKQIQELEEENYFFRWSKYTDFLKDLVSSKGFVLPQSRRKEMLSFVKQGIKDIPITRPKYKVSWGIQAPNDSEQVIYVWFDALINYFTAGSQSGFWDKNTKIIHILGKDNVRWHALLWPAMLKSAGYRIPDIIYAHGFINLEGQKISKSLGNVIRPSELVKKYGADAVRYYFLKHGSIVEDVNASIKHLEEVYNSDLANGLGNTVARLARLAEKSGLEFEIKPNGKNIWESEIFKDLRTDFRTDLTILKIWERLSSLDRHINENEPWAIKDKSKLKEVLYYEINELCRIALLVEPFIPETSQKIQKQFSRKKIKSQKGLFPRIS